MYHASETGGVVCGSSAAQSTSVWFQISVPAPDIPGSIAILGYQPSSTTHLSPSRANPRGLSPQAWARHLGCPMKLIMGFIVVRKEARHPV